MERRSSTFNPCFQFSNSVFLTTYGNVVYSFEVSLFFRKLFLKSVIFSDCQEWKGIRFSLATILTAGNCNLFKYTKMKNTIIFINCLACIWKPISKWWLLLGYFWGSFIFQGILAYQLAPPKRTPCPEDDQQIVIEHQ